MSPSATATRCLFPSRDGDSPTALGSLGQGLTTLPVKTFSPTSKRPGVPGSQAGPAALEAPHGVSPAARGGLAGVAWLVTNVTRLCEG